MIDNSHSVLSNGKETMLTKLKESADIVEDLSGNFVLYLNPYELGINIYSPIFSERLKGSDMESYYNAILALDGANKRYCNEHNLRYWAFEDADEDLYLTIKKDGNVDIQCGLGVTPAFTDDELREFASGNNIFTPEEKTALEAVSYDLACDSMSIILPFSEQEKQIISDIALSFYKSHIKTIERSRNEVIPMFENGYKFIYDSHGADSELNERTGNTATIIRPLTEDEADISDVGNMYKVRFEDGFETDVFEDEITKHMDYDKFMNLQEGFDDLYENARGLVINLILSHFEDSFDIQELEDFTGCYYCSYDDDEIFEDFEIEKEKYVNELGKIDWDKLSKEEHFIFAWSNKELADEIREIIENNPSVYTLTNLISYAKNMGIDLAGIEEPYKIIVLNDGPYGSLDNYEKVEKLLLDDKNIPEEMIDKFIVCYNKEDLIDKWKDNLKESEGAWYGVKNEDGLIVAGSYDPNDIQDLEELPSHIPEFKMQAKVRGIIEIEPDTAINQSNRMINEADFGDYRNPKLIEKKSKTELVAEASYIVDVYSYTKNGAIARAEDAFAKADNGDLKNVQLYADFEIIDIKESQGLTYYEKEANRLVEAVNNNLDAVIHFTDDNSKKEFVAFMQKDSDMKNVYRLVVKTNVNINGTGGKVIGSIDGLCGKEDVFTALENLNSGYAKLSTPKGRRIIKDILNNKDKERYDPDR